MSPKKCVRTFRVPLEQDADADAVHDGVYAVHDGLDVVLKAHLRCGRAKHSHAGKTANHKSRGIRDAIDMGITITELSTDDG